MAVTYPFLPPGHLEHLFDRTPAENTPLHLGEIECALFEMYGHLAYPAGGAERQRSPIGAGVRGGPPVRPPGRQLVSAKHLT